MIALGLVRLIERHSHVLEAELVVKIETSPRTADLRKIPGEECGDASMNLCRHPAVCGSS